MNGRWRLSVQRNRWKQPKGGRGRIPRVINLALMPTSTQTTHHPISTFLHRPHRKVQEFGFEGHTSWLNQTILGFGLSVNYETVKEEAEKLGYLTNADCFEIDFKWNQEHTLTLHTNGQNAQKSHGLCPPGKPDVANPAGEVYFVPESAEGTFLLSTRRNRASSRKDHKITIGVWRLCYDRRPQPPTLRGPNDWCDRRVRFWNASTPFQSTYKTRNSHYT